MRIILMWRSLLDQPKKKRSWGLGREPEEVEAIVQRRLDRQRRLEQVEADGRARNGANYDPELKRYVNDPDSSHREKNLNNRSGHAMKTRLLTETAKGNSNPYPIPIMVMEIGATVANPRGYANKKGHDTHLYQTDADKEMPTWI